MNDGLDIPEFLKIPQAVRNAAWGDRGTRKLRRGRGRHRSAPMSAFHAKLLEASREQARKLGEFKMLKEYEEAR